MKTKAATVSRHSRPKVGAQYGEERKFFIRRLSSSPLNTNPLLRNKSCIISFLLPPLLLHLLTLPRESEKKKKRLSIFLRFLVQTSLPFPSQGKGDLWSEGEINDAFSSPRLPPKPPPPLALRRAATPTSFSPCIPAVFREQIFFISILFCQTSFCHMRRRGGREEPNCLRNVSALQGWF